MAVLDALGRLYGATLEERFMHRVKERSNGCWEWTGRIDKKGYGRFGVDAQHRDVPAHRVAYVLFVSEIPDDMSVDHLCHTTACKKTHCRHRRCVNPAHLGIATKVDNARRGNLGTLNNHNTKKTHCPQGHRYTKKNTYVTKDGKRQCICCTRGRTERWREVRRKQRHGGA